MDIACKLVITQPMYFTEPCKKCGYCKNEKTNKEDYFSLKSWYNSHEKDLDTIDIENCTVGFQCENMTVEMYDKLCNMGFRRSGHFIYKPDLLRSCCRLYTIRTEPSQVHLTKEYKSSVKKFKHHILEPEQVNESMKNKKKNEPFDYIKEFIEMKENSKSFYTKFEPAIYTDEKYELFGKYQETVHNDFKHNKKSFERFLCDSPFPDNVKYGTQEEWDQLNEWDEMEPTDILKRIGPAHECYYYNDKLIGIAVTDFLPSGLSSVYFIWDPDFKKWSLGKISALRELSILSKINRPYYYLGYYVEDCGKMNYKGAYGGELLDICNSKYVSLDFLKKSKMLDNGKLFTIRDKSDGELRKEITLNDKLEKGFPTYDIDADVENVADRLFGKEGIAFNTENNNKTIDRLREYGIGYSEDNFTDLFKVKGPEAKVNSDEEETNEETTEEEDLEKLDKLKKLPIVMPGILPLSELLKMVESDQITELNGKLMIYDTQLFRIRPIFNFDNESEQIKVITCNLIRILGLELTKSALVIV